MNSSQPLPWAGSEFLFDSPAGAKRRTGAVSAYLFSARRFSLEIAALTRDAIWHAGHTSAHVRLSGLARFQGNPLKVIGPGSTEYTELDSTWLRIQAATERRERMDYSTLEISKLPHSGQRGLQSEVLLFVEPAKLNDLIDHLASSRGSLRVQFLLETEEGVSLAAGERKTSVPVYDVMFSLHQPALDSSSTEVPLLPQLQHAIKHCVPGAVRGTSQLEIIGEDIARCLSRGAILKTRGIDSELQARDELLNWLTDIRATMHGHAVRASEPWRTLYALPADEFELEIGHHEAAERMRLQKAYGRVWAHSSIGASRRQIGRKPELDQFDLAPEPLMLEDLAYRYCDDEGIRSATLEWCLADALLREDTVALARARPRILPKLRAAGLELCVQCAFAACAWVFSREDSLVFWMVFLALNILRWMSPGMSPALAKRTSRTGLLGEMRALHDTLAGMDFNGRQLLGALRDLAARGAPIRPVLLKLAEKSIRRQETPNPAD